MSTDGADTAGGNGGSAGNGAAGRAHEPELVQLLTPDGERVDHPSYSIDLTPAELRGLYRDMTLTRRFDGEAVALQRQGELALWVSALGQEAAQIGSARATRRTDYVFPSYREHGVAWCRGLDPLNLMGMYRGVTNGGWDPNEFNFHLYTIVIGPVALHATGYAMGVAKDGADMAVMCYFGEGGSSQGDVSEAFNFAAVNNAPVVFFCQNNQWSISTPFEKQSRVPVYQRAAGFGFPGVRVDGNDVLAVMAVTRAALDHARGNNGPVLVEALTYRMGAHATSDDPARYRIAEESAVWERKDPIARLRTHLERQGLAGADFLAHVDAEADALAARVRDGLRSMPDPRPTEFFDHVYAGQHALVDEERAQFEAYQAGFEENR